MKISFSFIQLMAKKGPYLFYLLFNSGEVVLPHLYLELIEENINSEIKNMASLTNCM